MADPRSPEDLASGLLAQEPSLNSQRYKEHRMQLEHQLARAERSLQITKWVVVVALLAGVVSMFVAGSRSLGSPDPSDRDATVLGVFFGVVNIIAAIVFYMGLASYFSRFRPRIHRLREDLQNESIRELRSEVAELKQMLAQSGKSADRPRSDPAE